MEKRPLGFSTGAFYRIGNPTSSEIFETACPPDHPMTPVEIGFLRYREGRAGMGELSLIVAREPEERLINIHAPTDIAYGENEVTREVIGLLNTFYPRVTHAVFHPDTIRTFSVFRELRLIPCLENSDQSKETGKSVEDMRVLLREARSIRSDFGMVLDLAHCKLNDPSMKLAYRFIGELGDMIRGIHVSGTGNGYHVPLSDTGEDDILTPLSEIAIDVPIIIESPVDDYAEAVAEWRYIMQRI